MTAYSYFKEDFLTLSLVVRCFFFVLDLSANQGIAIHNALRLYNLNVPFNQQLIFCC